MLLMVEKSIRGGICHAIHRYTTANDKYMKNYDKNNESSYLMYLHTNNLYGWTTSQKLPVSGFEWVEELSQFKEDFIKIMMKIVIRDIFLKKMLNIQKFFLIFIVIFHFYLNEAKLKNAISLFAAHMRKKKMLLT